MKRLTQDDRQNRQGIPYAMPSDCRRIDKRLTCKAGTGTKVSIYKMHDDFAARTYENGSKSDLGNSRTSVTLVIMQLRIVSLIRFG